MVIVWIEKYIFNYGMMIDLIFDPKMIGQLQELLWKK